MSNTPLTQTGHKAAVQETYRFEFGSDDRIYSASFRGRLRNSDILGILKAVQNSIYSECGEAIRDYLDSLGLAYSKFTVMEKQVPVTVPINFADRLLNDPSCDIVDKWIGGTGSYYAVMDCRDWMEEHCRGCYFVLARFPFEQNGRYEYHIISQTFNQVSSWEEEQSYFAVRKDDGEHRLITLDEDCSYPVLETFGCVDLLNLLYNITNITTKQHAADLANK